MSVPFLVKVFALINVAVLLYYILMGGTVEVNKTAPSASQHKPTYILDWTRSKKGSKTNYCPINPNCYFTNDRNLLPEVRDFDVIMFDVLTLRWLSFENLPKLRSRKQIYIFSSKEPPTIVPICASYYDGYFNWTQTYRLDSDILNTYFIVFDLFGNMVAPKVNVTWLTTYQPMNVTIRRKLAIKRKAAAWFVTHCKTLSKREDFIKEVLRYMEQYNMTVDIYGKCSKDLQCSKDHWYCQKMIESDYYFYFAFENSFHEDYVTEKVLTAVNNLAVPVVYGGADYSRFLPPGSYLDARKLGAELLASTMRDIIQNHTRYEDMFRWRNHYQIKYSFMTEVCDVCTKLDNTKKLSRVFMYNNFRDWWNVNPKLCSHR